MKTFFLWLVDIITWKSCISDQAILNATVYITGNKCADKAEKQLCIDEGGHCKIDIDGYYIEVAINVVYGIIWYQWGKRVLEHLQSLQRHEWHVLSSRPDNEEEELTALDELRDKV